MLPDDVGATYIAELGEQCRCPFVVGDCRGVAAVLVPESGQVVKHSGSAVAVGDTLEQLKRAIVEPCRSLRFSGVHRDIGEIHQHRCGLGQGIQASESPERLEQVVVRRGNVTCGERTSVTLFDRRRAPLTVWFEACWLFASGKDGMSALSLHRLRSVLVCPGRDRLTGAVEVDETYIGGKEPGLRGGRAKGKEALVGVAVEMREPRGFGRARMAILADGSAASLHSFSPSTLSRARG